MLTVYAFGPQWNLLDVGPFCTKLLAYLKLAGIEHEVETGFDFMRAAPKGKMPYIKDGDKVIGDSALIIDHLKAAHGDPLGEGLTPQQHTTTHIVSTMLAENTYWTVVYSRWVMEDNWEKFTMPTFFGDMNVLLKAVLPRSLRAGVIKQLKGHGMGRHSEAEVFAAGIKDLQSLGELLGDQDYFFGDRARELDANAYAFLSAVIAPPHESPMKDFVNGHQQLLAYYQRMDAELKAA